MLRLELGVTVSHAITCPACGALNHMPTSSFPSDIAPILAKLLPDATGRSLEAVATLLASLVGSKQPSFARKACSSLLCCRHTPHHTPQPHPLLHPSPHPSPHTLPHPLPHLLLHLQACNSFLGCRGVLAVLNKCHELVAVQHAETYHNSRFMAGGPYYHTHYYTYYTY